MSVSRRKFLALSSASLLGMGVNAFASDRLTTGAITAIAPAVAKQPKLATHTEILTGKDQAPMLTPGSLRALEGAIDMYSEIVAGGGWLALPTAKYDAKATPKLIALLRQRLVREGYLDFQTLTGPDAGQMDSAMLAAVKSFQFNHGLLVTGKVDEKTRVALNVSADERLFTLRDNHPRVREYISGLGSRYIVVNIPACQLETIELGQIYSRHNVVTGKIDRPTPSLKSRVSDIVFNPYWNAPASIVARDIIPKYLADPGYLEQMRIHVYDGVNGPEIEPSSVDWQNTASDRYVFQQEPGEHNALATVKINFPNQYMVYMHDTPHREGFQLNQRFDSSGCVRVDQVRVVIDWVMHGQGGYADSMFQQIIATRQTQQAKIINPPDVRFMYLTAWATEDGRVNFRPDVYRLDGKGFVLGQPDPVVSL
ncbi:MAG: L,D-transpeptidase family protein [Aestuariivirga sp.]